MSRDLKEWAKTTTFHGVGHILRSKSIIRIIWTTAVVISSFFCFYQNVKTAENFLQYKKFTSTQVKNDGELRFPTVDFCNLNMVDYNNQRNFSDVKYKQGFRTMRFTSDFLFNTGLATSYTFNQTVYSCTFNGNPCDEKDFYYYYDYSYGNCYSFNGPAVKWAERKVPIHYPEFPGRKALNITWRETQTDRFKSVKLAGMNSGLVISFFIDNEDVTNDPKYVAPTSNYGIRLVVYDNRDFPTPRVRGMDVSVGYDTSVALFKKETVRLPYPYSNCLSELNNKTIKGNKILREMKEVFGLDAYNKDTCVKLCIQNIYKTKCKCFESHYPFDVDKSKAIFLNNIKKYKDNQGCDYFTDDQVDSKPCIMEKINGCVDSVNQCAVNLSKELENNNQIKSCFNDCPVQCNETNFYERITFSKYPTRR
jgi:hypothetical protein